MELKIKIAFTDKYDLKKHYSVDDVITVDEARGNELLADDRHLVELVEKPTEEEKQKKKAKK